MNIKIKVEIDETNQAEIVLEDMHRYNPAGLIKEVNREILNVLIEFYKTGALK